MATETAAERAAGTVEWVLDRDDLPLLLVLPGLLAWGAFMFYPVVYTIYLSFTNAAPATLFQNQEQFIWLANYREVLTDMEFWNSLGVTWLFVATSVTLKVMLGLGIAMWLTHDRVRGSRYLRSFVILPMGLPNIFTITVWRGIFSPARFGLLNSVIETLNLHFLITGYNVLLGQSIAWPVPWFQYRWLAFLSYNVTEAWLAYPFMVIITVSALQNVNGDLLDAAKVDGAGYLSRIVHVVIPSIWRPLMFASILTAAASFQQYLIPYVFNRGGPGRTNQVVIVYGYQEAFQFNLYGRGAAIMMIAMAFIGAFMWINVKWGRLAEGVNEA